ncbi:MAG: S-methyl-5'-thioadenosine phosphorylase [Candidatus Heimdallarchaeota archaeon]|nr:S-methyl-5'-thioadenosine phosphorylase [Candidatus Heimdallarchaeota archaeon]
MKFLDSSSSIVYAIIGGSGFYDFLSSPTKIQVETPFKKESITLYRQTLNENVVYFLPRHGLNHSIPPHMINYKANLFALHKLNVSRIIATCAVGSLKHDLSPGNLVVLDQFIDFVRPLTYFDGKFSLRFPSGSTVSGVTHLDMTEPYCPEIRQTIISVLGESPIVTSGTYFTCSGPRFETLAEIKALQLLGADVVGMTNSSEAILARELGICYGVIAVVTNYAAGLQETVSQEEVIEIFKHHLGNLKAKIPEIFTHLPHSRRCGCSNHTK